MLFCPSSCPAHPLLSEKTLRLAAVVACGIGGLVATARAAEPLTPATLVQRYCIDCHDADKKKGDVSLEGFDLKNPAAQPELAERVIKKLVHRQMPPADEPRPDEASYNAVVAQLQNAVDRAAAAAPNPGRTDSIRRLNRTEYQNAIRDLLGVQIDAAALLPNDESSHGFDNITVGNLSPTLLDRYVTAAQKIARLAVGTAPRRTPGGDTVRIRPDVTQEEHVEGLPLGTRGGTVISYSFPQDGLYEVQIRLTRDRNENVEGLQAPHQVEVLLDRESMATFTVEPPADKNFDAVDRHLKARIPVKAGPHQLGITFVKNPSSLLETGRQPFTARFNMHRHPRNSPAVYQVLIIGPYDPKGPGHTPSRQLIFGDQAETVARLRAPVEREAAARGILAKLMRRAYRRPVTDADLQKPLEFFRQGQAEGGDFDAGIETALSAVLVSPRFLFRVESDPAGLAPRTPHKITDLELASRLSFFLWSSIPDDALLDAAERGELSRPAVLEAQTRRMLADPRSRNLVTNFANQWLYLRNLDSITPDLRLFPDFDDNLRQAFKQETELFFESVMREDRSVTDLLHADYTFLNERLAKHYGIPHIYGSRFRRVDLGPDRQRGGLLRHGSILTVTSYATRTSPVIRGHWILANLVGAPPPPPPPDVPSLDDNTVSASLPIRERLAAHRANPACASCHNVMDPVGFALENFDAVGRWRTQEEGKAVDATGGLPDGSRFAGVTGLERGLRARPELLATTLSEKLLTFALGRGVEYYDAPAVRRVVSQARPQDYRFSSLIVGIVQSTPFNQRNSP